MKSERPRKAIGYARVSSSKQVKVGDGLKSQETRCAEFARMKGYDLVATFDDDASGGSVDRKGMNAALAYVRAHPEYQFVIIIDDVSRLARGLEQHLQLRAAIHAAGAILESPSIEFGEDSDSILVENLLASVSQHQRQKNGEQTKNRMRARVMNGYWPFHPAVGFKHVRVSGRGMLLQRDEPVASIVQEALEGYERGRFDNQADVMRFLQDQPLFPKDSRGLVRHQSVSNLLTNPLYAGYVHAPKWNVSLREGQHEGLISYESFRRIQDRLNGGSYAPRKKNLNEDFPLRGYVLCAECDTPLTACWSKGSNAKYPYYYCPRRGCDCYGKTIRRDKIEGEFETLIQSVQPTEALFRVAHKMFKDLWDDRHALADTRAKALGVELAKTERKIEQFLERILAATSPSVVGAYENEIQKLEGEKIFIKESMAKTARPRSSYDDTVRTALDFLSNPWNLWRSGQLEDRKLVLKLVFAERLRYVRNGGFRTTNLTLPFKVLGDFLAGENNMAHPTRFELVTFAFGGQNL